MRYAVLGTGMVGQALAGKLVELGHEVRMGSREAGNEKAVAFVESAGDLASEGTFAGAAAFGEAIVNATAGLASVDALSAAGADNLAGKVLIDVSNALDSSGGMPPTVGLATDDSVGERIQAAFPEARVVKSLNTVNNTVMVDPSLLPEASNIFVCGNDDGAKLDVVALLRTFGWPADSIVDLGDISASRGVEMYVALWVRLYGHLGGPSFNIRIVGSG